MSLLLWRNKIKDSRMISMFIEQKLNAREKIMILQVIGNFFQNKKFQNFKMTTSQKKNNVIP